MTSSIEPPTYVVQILNGERALCSERCENPDEAATIAERLWDLFVEPAGN